MIYLDSAAVVELVREEEETSALVAWLNERAGQRLVASALVKAEVPRALRRSQLEVLGAVAATSARIDRVELVAAIRPTTAANVDLLRSRRAGQASWTRDKRLVAAADDLESTCSTPRPERSTNEYATRSSSGSASARAPVPGLGRRTVVSYGLLVRRSSLRSSADRRSKRCCMR